LTKGNLKKRKTFDERGGIPDNPNREKKKGQLSRKQVRRERKRVGKLLGTPGEPYARKKSPTWTRGKLLPK